MEMGEATGPPPAITGTAALMAVVSEAAAEIRRAQDLIRRDIARRGPLAELTLYEIRLAELEATFRRGTMWHAADPVVSAPPLAAVPVPRRGRHRSPRALAGDRPLMTVLEPPAPRHAAGTRRAAAVSP